ncbi:hypothetical protein [Sandarakinorhabdus rubra]|uniref:hypothetical protein n=1 Tax=Sandarakinorhabdus rubra TaxID=2672568 RepID=UPI0013DB0CB8|nr:hypothetical protein [Sandarakinorhabdus rubra]
MRATASLALFAALLASPLAAQAPPKAEICRNDARYRAQDFTLGNWDVFSGTTKTAEVSMTLILNDCVIEERWTGYRGGDDNGIGLFNFSPLLGNWGYYWATDAGTTTSFRGGLIRPGEMRYVTERPLGGGKVRLRHWTLSANPDGSIRELSVGSEDGGQTWSTEYDLKWVRRR